MQATETDILRVPGASPPDGEPAPQRIEVHGGFGALPEAFAARFHEVLSR